MRIAGRKKKKTLAEKGTVRKNFFAESFVKRGMISAVFYFQIFDFSFFLSMHSIIFFPIFATHSAHAECAELLEATE